MCSSSCATPVGCPRRLCGRSSTGWIWRRPCWTSGSRRCPAISTSSAARKRMTRTDQPGRSGLAPWWNDSPGRVAREPGGARPVKARFRRLVNTRPRKITALVLVAGLVLGIVWIAWPASPPTPVATRDVTITAPGGPGVAEPVQLDVTVYLPQRTPAPAIIMAHGFGGSKQSVAADAQDAARNGFVVLAYSARGFGRSTGLIGLDSLDYEVPDARAIVDWLAQQPEVQLDAPGDPRVGVTGGSYGGALSLMLAGTDPRVDAVVPLITWNDLEQSLFPNAQTTSADLAAQTPAAAEGVTDGVFKKFWT